MKNLKREHLKSICDILADTNYGLTKKEINSILHNCNIAMVDDGASNNGMSYTIGLNKREYLYNCFVNKINNTKNCDCVYEFIKSSLNPISYTKFEKRAKFNWLREELNKVLMLLGMEVDESGEIIEIVHAKTLSEVDRRVSSLNKKLFERTIHSEVRKYCDADFLKKDYFDAVFEASKGLAERVRKISGLNTDGDELFDKAFSTKDPYIVFNKLQSKSEISEHIGLKELLSSIFHLARNPEAHSPKINWKIDEIEALDILTLISFAHKYLDVCFKNPAKP